MKLSIGLFLLVLCTIGASAEEVHRYNFMKGDTLSNVLYNKYQIKPIYGKKGFLEKIVKYNHYSRRKVRAGDVLFIPSEYLDKRQERKIGSVPNIINTEEKKSENEVAISSPIKVDFKSSFFWEIEPTVSWKNLSSTDENVYRSSQIQAMSEKNYGVSLSYGIHFKENVDVYTRITLESVTFVQDSSINLLKKKLIASSFGVGRTYERWRFEISMRDEFYLTSPNASSVDIKLVTLPQFKTTYLKDFSQYRKAKLSYSLSGNVFLPKASVEIKPKLSYGAGGAIEARLHNQSFSIGYDLNLLKASGNSTNYQNIYWKYNWETL